MSENFSSLSTLWFGMSASIKRLEGNILVGLICNLITFENYIVLHSLEITKWHTSTLAIARGDHKILHTYSIGPVVHSTRKPLFARTTLRFLEPCPHRPPCAFWNPALQWAPSSKLLLMQVCQQEESFLPRMDVLGKWLTTSWFMRCGTISAPMRRLAKR